jgi:TrmH family RNA methyltransferase
MLTSGRVRSISSRQNPIVRMYRDLALSPPSDGSSLLLEGVHLVEEARAARVEIGHAAVAATRLADGSEIAVLAETLQRENVDVAVVTDPVMSAISPLRSPSGIVAIARLKPASLPEICQPSDALIVAAVGVQDPGNLGALLRAAEAGGATGAVVCGASASPFSWKALRGSMGSVLRLPLAVGLAPEDVLTRARAFGVRVMASLPRGGTPPAEIDWRGRVLLFVGGEGPGLSPETIAACDARVTVPMRPPVESLNVAVAGALLIYEARRQRA